LAGFFFQGLVALCRHGLFSRTIPAKSAPGGLIFAEEGPFSPVPVPVLPEEGLSGESVPEVPSSGHGPLTRGRVLAVLRISAEPTL
jgi:hypothetical protein